MGTRKSGDNAKQDQENDLFREIYKLTNRSCLDPSTVNGSVLVYNNRFEDAIGSWNQLIVDYGEARNLEILNDRQVKYDNMMHAERQLIYSVIHKGKSWQKEFDKSVLYITWTPCLECSKTIIGVGIPEIVLHIHKYSYEREDWKENMEKAKNLLLDSGVNIRYNNCKLGVKTLFNGRMVSV